MGIGDWGLGIRDWGLGPIPNPQSPLKFKLIKLNIIPNPKIIIKGSFLNTKLIII